MSFFNHISSFVQYLHSVRKLENYLSFDLQFPSKWSLPKNIIDENKTIPFDTGDQNVKGVSFVCEINDSEIGITIGKINRTIKLNLEREIKEKLFKQTIDQLKKTFESNDLEKLQKLYFDFDSEDTNLEVIEDEQDEQGPTTVELVGE
jgi:hypothetical protein